ncbi:hypothetical protein HDU76_004558 [Blyttiomyces sp. JEL0837]|nr:hypothetical protein HDU76_004558 [Blyttiomyces sp. JEL0837]
MCLKNEKVDRTVKELDDHVLNYMGYFKTKIDFQRLKAPWRQSQGLKVISGPVGIPQSHVQFVAGTSLQHLKSTSWNVTFEEMSCSCGVVKGIATRNAEKSHVQAQKEAIGLFYDVMIYYGWEYEYSEEKVVSIRMGGVLNTMTQELWRSNKECYLVVEDPFQLDRNVAATLFSHSHLVKEFRRAVRILSDVASKGTRGSGKAFADVFEEI